MHDAKLNIKEIVSIKENYSINNELKKKKHLTSKQIE